MMAPRMCRLGRSSAQAQRKLREPGQLSRGRSLESGRPPRECRANEANSPGSLPIVRITTAQQPGRYET